MLDVPLPYGRNWKRKLYSKAFFETPGRLGRTLLQALRI